MSISAHKFVLIAALAAGAFVPAARGEDPSKQDDSQKKGVLTPDVDFSKPPHLVEAYNKARIKAKATRDPKTNALTIEVTGKAYYPDGVSFTIDARYWKHMKPFISTKATVKDRAFTAKFGPFQKEIPGGALSIEAWFIATDQSPEVRDRLTKGNYFHCSPPCHYDRRNVTRDTVEVGGKEAQSRDEQLEKKEITKLRSALLDAAKVADKTFTGARSKEKSVKDAESALAQLEQDESAALDSFTKWRGTREMLLFPEQAAAAERIAQLVKDTARAHAAVAGVKVPGIVAGAEFATYTRTSNELSKASDELKSWLDEKDSLDRSWNDLAKAAQNRSGQATPPKAGGK